jgi:hypothetical protein
MKVNIEMRVSYEEADICRLVEQDLEQDSAVPSVPDGYRWRIDCDRRSYGAMVVAELEKIPEEETADENIHSDVVVS